ncbi:MAG TPA: hypothetical protein PLL71_02695 [Agriterribacter sp.]|nr:hypothetical protein [Agriterribacter sp.]
MDSADTREAGDEMGRVFFYTGGMYQKRSTAAQTGIRKAGKK